MKKSELARYLDLVSDEVDENPPTGVMVKGAGSGDCLPTDGEMFALRVGIIGGLMHAMRALTGEERPGDPARDAKVLMGDAIAVLVGEKLGAGHDR